MILDLVALVIPRANSPSRKYKKQCEILLIFLLYIRLGVAVFQIYFKKYQDSQRCTLKNPVYTRFFN